MGLRRHARALAIKSTVLYVVGHVLDLVTTFILSPHLNRETNVMVYRFGFGWGYLLVAAAASSVLVLAALWWMWPRVVERFPHTPTSYLDFYRRVLYRDAPGRKPGRRALPTGFLIGIVCTAVYAAIAAKLLTDFWNLYLVAFGGPVSNFLVLPVLTAGLSALVGLCMFFVYPFLLHRRVCRGTCPPRIRF